MITIKSSRSLNLFQLKKKSRKKRSESLKIPPKVYQKSIETLFKFGTTRRNPQNPQKDLKNVQTLTGGGDNCKTFKKKR